MKLKYFLLFLLSVVLLSQCSHKKISDLAEPFLRNPGNFKAQVTSASSVLLTWELPLTDFKLVKLYRSIIKHPSSPQEGELIYQGRGTQFIDSGLTSGQRYYYSIFAFYDETTHSDRTSTNAIPFDLTLPRNIQILKQIGKITLKWEKPYDVHFNGVRIIRSESDNISSPQDSGMIYEGTLTEFIDGLDTLKPLTCDTAKLYYYYFYTYNENNAFSASASKHSAFCWPAGSFDISITVTEPKNNAILGPFSAKISAVIETQNASITKAEARLNGGAPIILTHQGNSIYEAIFNYGSLPEGPVSLSVTAYNSEGLVKTVSASLTLDKTKPQITITFPGNNAKVSGLVLIQGSATDNIGVKNVDLFIDGQLVKKDLTAPYQLEWKTTDSYLFEGGHTIQLRAYDYAENYNFAEIFVTVDNPPFILSTGPANNAENISYTTTVSAVFNELIVLGAGIYSVFFIQNPAGEKIAGTIHFNAAQRTLIFTPSVPLDSQTIYTATITNQIKDLNGNSMLYHKTWSFKTSLYTNLYDDPNALFDYSTFSD